MKKIVNKIDNITQTDRHKDTHTDRQTEEEVTSKTG